MNENQDSERNWWGDCATTWQEERKQISYAKRMGITIGEHNGQHPIYYVPGQTVLDLGGGPVSMLLKTAGIFSSVVVDPCNYPSWIKDRYRHCGIEQIVRDAEAFSSARLFDECWIYNTLQHVVSPAAVIETALTNAKLLRIFEWIEIPPHQGHPHQLTKKDLDSWCGGDGTVERGVDREWAPGVEGNLSYSGVFAGVRAGNIIGRDGP